MITIQVPYFTSKTTYADPTHKQVFSKDTFYFFVNSSERQYYFDFHFSKIELKITFEKRIFYFYNYFLEFFVNLHPKLQSFYESSFLRAFPADGIHVKLIK